jgi:hypothetical protein
MAQTNYTPVSLYYSTTASAVPLTGNLNNGELSINITDGKLYYKDNSGVVQVLATKAATSGTFTTISVTTVNATTVNDSIGNVRNIPVQAKIAAYVLTATDNGQCISITTGGVTLNSGIFSAGNNIVIYNNSASNQTITQGSGVTLTLVLTGTTGNRTLAPYGFCTIICLASNSFIISGSGVS